MDDERVRRKLWDRRLTILAGLLALPYLVSAVMLLLYYELDEGFSRHIGILLAMEHEAPLFYGVVPALLLWCIESRNGAIRWTGKTVLLGFVLCLAVARACQTISILHTRQFMSWDHFGRWNMIGFVFTPFHVTLFVSIVATGLMLVGLAWSSRFAAVRRSNRSYAAIVVACACLSFYAGLRADRGRYLERFSNQYGISHSHESSMFRMLLRMDGSAAEEVETLSADTTDRLRAFGILVQPDAKRPFRRDLAFDPAVATPWQPFERPPDIVILFAESLSARLIGCYGGRTGVSPWIDELARRSIRFTNYFNHSTPTVCGLHGSLTSSYQVAGHDSYSGEELNLVARTRALSLAHVLEQRGYDTTYFGPGSPHEDRLDDVMANLGFRRRMFADDLRREYPDVAQRFDTEYPSCRTRLASDILMCRYVREFMAKPSTKPRLLCVSTVGMHFPYDFGEGVRYEDGSQPVLNALHLLDRALAESGEFVQGSDRERVFVLTADHAMFPTLESIAARETDYNTLLYDRIALLISRSGSDREYAIDTLSSSVDLVPTLLHLLRINVPNPFMGWSIFAERRAYPRLLGSHNKHLFVKTSDGEWSPLFEELNSMPDIALDDGQSFESRHFREWLAYLRFQMRKNRIW